MTLYERYTTGDDYRSAVYDPERYGQTFTVGNTGANETHAVNSVKLKLSRIGLPGTITIAIHNVDGNGRPTGDPLCSVNYNGNTVPTTATWVEFVFASPATLSASTQYAIVASAPNGDQYNYIEWRRDATSPTYTGGRLALSVNSGSSWETFTDHDFMFQEYGTALPPPPLGLCAWIASKGGPSGLNILDIFELIDSYLFITPPTGYTFVPTLQNIFGVIDYYLGFNGDPLTGCDYF